MKFRHNETGQIYNGEYEFRMAYSNISFPATLDQNALDHANVSIVIEVQPPECTLLQRIEYDGVQLRDNQWTEVWSIHNKFDDPTEQATWEAEVTQSQWNVVRDERDVLLKNTDYTDLPNTPITQECRNNFITYRQQLRDVTKQTDPFNITWPVIPLYEVLV